jgi:putative phage-type endonuclease
MGDFKEILKKDTVIQRTEEWYSLRENMLTASDVATALGLNPYRTPKNLLMSKTSKKKGGRFESEATKHGNMYEDRAIERFCELTGHVVHNVGIFVHDEHKWLGGSPDGLTETCELVEVKCPLTREIKHEIPEYYFPQVQVCMEILDVPKCYFIQYKPPDVEAGVNEILDILEVPRDKNWFNENLPTMKRFWEDVMRYRDDESLYSTLYGIDDDRICDLSDITVPYHGDEYAFMDD